MALSNRLVPLALALVAALASVLTPLDAGATPTMSTSTLEVPLFNASCSDSNNVAAPPSVPHFSSSSCFDSRGNIADARSSSAFGRLGAFAHVNAVLCFSSDDCGGSAVATAHYDDPGNMFKSTLSGSITTTFKDIHFSASPNAGPEFAEVDIVAKATVNGQLAVRCDAVQSVPDSKLDKDVCAFFEVTVPLNQAFDINLDLSASAFANAGFLGNQSATTNAANTFEFALDGPIFDLPDGVTYDAPDSFIFDNRFLPPDAVAASEPAAASLFGLALALIAVRRRRA